MSHSSDKTRTSRKTAKTAAKAASASTPNLEQQSVTAEKCSVLLKAIADPNRLLIIRALRERPQSVSDLSALLDLDIGTVSHHLKVLRHQDLVSFNRQGKESIYSLAQTVFQPSRNQPDRLDLGCCRLELPN